MMAETDTSPVCGLNVTSRSPCEIDVHCVAAGQEMESSRWICSVSIVTGGVAAGVWGLNVTSRPSSSTAVHWVLSGQATFSSSPLGSIVCGVAPAGEAGLNVTSLVVLIAVHCVVVAHEIETSPNSSPGSSEATTGAAAEPGVKLIASPAPSSATHCVAVGQATSLTPISDEAAAPGSMSTGCGATGWLGSNVKLSPLCSTTVHCCPSGQATPAATAPASSMIRVAEPGDAGS